MREALVFAHYRIEDFPKQRMSTSVRVPHQLSIHLDYFPGDRVELRYSYPRSAPHPLPEQVVTVPAARLSATIRQALDGLVESLASRIPPRPPVHVPHADIHPRLIVHILTVVIQDQARVDILPVIRLTYSQEVQAPLSRGPEEQVRVDKPTASVDEIGVWRGVRPVMKKLAWEDYQRRVLGPSQS